MFRIFLHSLFIFISSIITEINFSFIYAIFVLIKLHLDINAELNKNTI